MNRAVTHAGGIVHRPSDGRVLLVRARPAPHDWVIPKGHIEDGETPEAAAVREVREEAGVVGTIIARLGEFEYMKPNDKRAVVACYLMRFVGDSPADEDREIRWCTFDEAVALVMFESTRELLEAARRAIRR